MIKVLKTSSLEVAADFEEFFDGATVEEATKKAHDQRMPTEFAKVNIIDSKLLKANIKIVNEENDGSK
jgi:hypothetical protein|tara:strand:+ start:37 stop:240 length:204 start_codon:yes stop_codon:yes gene_type:complete